MRIAILSNAPAPYRTPVFERIAAQPQVELRVFFDSASEAAVVDREPGYPHEFLAPAFGVRVRNYQDEADWAERIPMRFALGYRERLAAFRPDVVVSGEFGWRTLNAALCARALEAPLLVWWEGTRFTERHLGIARRCARLGLARVASGLLGLGRGSVEYLRELVGESTPIAFVPQAVDDERIARETDRSREDRDFLREQYGARGVALLCLSRMLPHKGIPQLLDALHRLAAARPECEFTALFAGEGPEAERVERAARALPGRVRNLGGIEPDALPRLFAASDLLVFPSLRDCWGMVVNEALAAGLPVLGSRYAGAATELLGEDDLGRVIDPLDPASIDAALVSAVCDGRWRSVAPAKLRAALKGYGCRDAADAIVEAARRAVETERSQRCA